MNIRRTLKTLAATAALTLTATLALTACTPASDQEPMSAVEIMELFTGSTDEQAATEAPEPTATPTAEPEPVSLTDGLNAGDVIEPDLCEQINNDPSTFGRGYVMADGSCRFVRYGDPMPEEVRLDIEQSVQGYPANTVFLTEPDRIGESVDGLEVGFLVCYGSGWVSSKPSPHHGSYEQMVADLDAWVAAGTSRSYVTVNQC